MIKTRPAVQIRPRLKKTNRSKSARKGVNTLFIFLAVIGSFHVLIMLGIETYRASLSHSEIGRLSQDVSQLENEKAQLQLIINHKDDVIFKEHLARCLGFVYPNETRYLTPLEQNQPILNKDPCNLVSLSN